MAATSQLFISLTCDVAYSREFFWEALRLGENEERSRRRQGSVCTISDLCELTKFRRDRKRLRTPVDGKLDGIPLGTHEHVPPAPTDFLRGPD